jgi:NADH:ubiquinone oxidoreductase subunit E
MKITVCIGSSCHLKGSRQVVEQLKELITAHGLEEDVELSVTFCMGKCEQGVSETLDDQQFSLSPDNTKEFFEKNIRGVLAAK